MSYKLECKIIKILVALIIKIGYNIGIGLRISKTNLKGVRNAKNRRIIKNNKGI